MIKNLDIKNMISNEVSLEYSKNIIDKLDKKTFLLQFLPKSIEHLETEKTIEFDGIKLKTSYLIDIIHNLVLKYYFKKENRFPLNATILKDKYGYQYNYYIKYLVDNKILTMLFNYKKGYSSRVYGLDKNIFKSKIKRHKNKDKVLLKKYKKKISKTIDYSDQENYLIEKEIREKLISDLFDVEIQYDRSIFFLDSLKDNDIDIYNRNVYSVDCINEKHIFYHFDSYGRMHTNFTILRSFIRKNCLLIGGEETCEIDIQNSQPLFLSKLIMDIDSKWVDKDEFALFKYLTSNGKYYQYVQDCLDIKDRGDAKELTYKVLFGKNFHNSKADKQFITMFPTIHNFIKLYKKEHGNYKMMAYDLQKAESNLIFNNIIKRVIKEYPEIKMITVHDSIILPKKWSEVVNNIFNDELNKDFQLI